MTVAVNVSDSPRPFTAAAFPCPPPLRLSLVTISTFLQRVGVAGLTLHSGYPRAQDALSLILSPW